MFLKYVFICLLIVFHVSESARILVAVPTPSLSHQVVFRLLTQELAKNHEVVVLTTDPAFTAKNRPRNLTEIDVHDVSYDYFRRNFRSIKMGTSSDSINVFSLSYKFMIDVFEIQLQQPDVKKIFNETFDLVLVESWFRPFTVFSAFWRIPVIKISSFNVLYNDYNAIGSFEHPIYPYPSRQKIFNMSFWDEVCELSNDYKFMNVLSSNEDSGNKMLRRNLGNIPGINSLADDVQMLYANVMPTWGSNRPVPLSVVYVAGIYEIGSKQLPEDLQSYFDKSQNGVIYVSFGTHVIPSLLPADRMKVILDVLSRLPYDVLFKWDLEIMPGKPENVKIAKWFPQMDVLSHPKVKLFITQGGLQSTEEAIRFCVPLLGIPLFMDHWYNSERYIQHGIGLKLEFESITADQMTIAIETLIHDNKDNSYRENLVKLRTIINDQPQSSLERAVWWTEHVLRHGGARHLRAPAANMGWAEYYEVDLLFLVLCFFVLTLTLIYVLTKLLFKCIFNKFK